MHATQYLDALGTDMISTGFAASGTWIKEFAGESVQHAIQGEIYKKWRQAAREFSKRPYVGWLAPIASNVLKSFIFPGGALARVLSGPRQYAQAMTTYATRVNPLIAMQDIPFMFKELFYYFAGDFRRVHQKTAWDTGGLLDSVTPSNDLNVIAAKVLKAHSDVPLSQRQSSTYQYLGMGRLSRGKAAAVSKSFRLLGGMDRINANIMQRLKEGWELAASRVSINRGKLVYQSVVDSIKSGISSRLLIRFMGL